MKPKRFDIINAKENIRYIEDDNRLCVFYVIHKLDKNIYIRGMMEATDFYEGVENPIRYQHENGEWKQELPPNPYEKNTINYNRYQELIENFNTEGDFKDWLYMADDQKPEIEEHEKYILEMKSIYYGD